MEGFARGDEEPDQDGLRIQSHGGRIPDPRGLAPNRLRLHAGFPVFDVSAMSNLGLRHAPTPRTRRFSWMLR